MNENLNIQSVQKIQNIAVYAKDVVLKKIDKVVVDTQRDNPKLLELFSDKFFYEVHKQLEGKKKIYNIYFVDLQNMKKDFDAQIELKDTRISSNQIEYKDMIVAALAAFSILIAKLDVKIEEIKKKIVGVDHEESY